MLSTAEQKLTRNQWLVGGGVLATFLALHGWSLLRFPAPFVDEAWLASRAWAFMRTGLAFGPLDSGVADRFAGYWTYNQWLMTFLDSLVLRFFNTPNLLAVRIVSLLFGLILLALVYVIAHRLGGQRLGLLSVVLVSVSWPFLYSAHLARYDIVAAAFGFAAIALYLNNRSSFWVGLLAGVCVGLSFEIHPNGMIYAPAILALYFWDVRWSMLRQRWFWGLMLGGSIGLLFYAALHILPYPQTYLTLSRLAFAATRTPPLVTLDLRVMLQALIDSGWMLFGVYQPLLVIILWAIVVLLQRHSTSDQRLLVLIAALVLAHTLLIRNKFLYYAILVTPMLDVLVAAFLLEFIRWPWRGRLGDYLSRILVWGLTIGSIALTWSVLRTDFWRTYQVTQSRINQAIRPGDSIMGSQVYWFGLYDHVYYSWELLPTYQRYAPGSTLEDALREFHPDVFIRDGHVSTFVVDPGPQGDQYIQSLRLPRAELESFLNRRAELINSFYNSYFREVRMYRIKWTE